MKQALRVINSLLIIGMGAAFLWHFNNIRTYGSMLISEPRPLVLMFEIIFISIVVAYGIAIFLWEAWNGKE